MNKLRDIGLVAVVLATLLFDLPVIAFLAIFALLVLLIDLSNILTAFQLND